MSRASGQLEVGPAGHVVTFYAAEEELAGHVSRYLAEGLRSGAGAAVVATAAHRHAFAAGLAEAGLDPAREQDAGRLLMVDASALLGSFLDGDRIDHDRFRSAAGGLVRRAADGGRPVRVYGEMVALLWDAGDVALAIELEELWNGLGGRMPFSLLCGYPASVLDGRDAAGTARDVCGLHSAVAGARSFTAELDSVRAARHYVTGLLGPAAGETAADDAAIVATELAANAVLHARTGFTLTVSRSAASQSAISQPAGAVRIEVRDNAPLAGTDEDVPFEIMTGHGLGVVSRLASRWAVERLPDGKVVWAELPAAGCGATVSGARLVC